MPQPSQFKLIYRAHYFISTVVSAAVQLRRRVSETLASSYHKKYTFAIKNANTDSYGRFQAFILIFKVFASWKGTSKTCRIIRMFKEL